MSIIRVQPIVEVQKNFADFCRLPNVLMRICGEDFIDVPRPQWWKWLLRLYSVTSFCSNLYCFYFISKEVFSMLIAGVPELALFLRLLSGFNYSFFAMVKFISFRRNMRGARNINMQLKEIYPKSLKEQRVYRVNAFFWPKWIRVIVYFYLGAVAMIATSPLMEGVILYTVDMFRLGVGDARFGYYKLYDILYSFDHRKPLSYLLTYGIELLHAQFSVICNLCGDIWLLCFTMQLCMHFDQLVRTMDRYEPDEDAEQKDQRFIAGFVKKHQILLNIGADVNAVFGVLLLYLLMSTTATICCAGVYTLSQGLGREFLEYCAFLPCLIAQYYFMCYYGQQLAGLSESVASAAYNHPWYNGSQSYKKSILIIMIRSQRPLELNANGFRPICLEAFQMVMGESYRLFALLKQTMFE